MIPNRNPYDEMGVFEQLKPIYGRVVDQWWYAHEAARTPARHDPL